MRVGSLVKRTDRGSLGIVVKMTMWKAHIFWQSTANIRVWNVDSQHLEVICE